MKLRPFLASAMLAGAVLCSADTLREEGQRWWEHVRKLASDDMKGRLAGSPEHRKAAGYVAGEFERLGLRPAGKAGFLQPVELESRSIVEEKSSLALVRDGRAEPLRLGADAYFSIRSAPVQSLEAPLVFAGYGLSLPAYGHDDLKGLDLRGKVAVIFSRGVPKGVPVTVLAHAQSTAERWKHLREAGAIGVLSVSNPKFGEIPWDRQAASRLQPQMNLADRSLQDSEGLQMSIVVNPAVAERLFTGTGHTFKDLAAVHGEGKPVPRFPLQCSLRARAAVVSSRAVSENAAAVLPGSDPALSREYIVLSAHLDHLGVGEPVLGDRIYNGAMDNASGIATLIETASALAAASPRPKRSILFVAVTAEEKGLLGSKFFAAHPSVPKQSMVANINFDMFLPLYPLKSVIIYGVDESTLGDMARREAARLGIKVQPDPSPQRVIFIRSDQYSFIQKGVPAVFFKFGEELSGGAAKTNAWLHDRYHAPSDDLSQPVDLEAAASFNRYMLDLVRHVANAPRPPEWHENSFFRRFAQK